MEHNIIDGDIVIFGKSSLNQPIQIDEDNVYYVMKVDEVFGTYNV